MSSEPQPLRETPPVAQLSTTPRRAALLVTEDWLLAAWVSVATPLLFRAQGGRGPFDSGAPLLGTLRIVAVAGALVCLAARRAPGDAAAAGRSIIKGGAVGPLVGAILLVTISGFTAVDLAPGVGTFIVIAALVAMVTVHFAVPPLAAPIRRALVTPFVLVSGALFWTFIAAITGEPGSATPEAAIANPATALAAGGFLIAFSGVFYVMLIFAPRQVADREGGIVSWLVRYALFAAGVIAGLAWPRLPGI
ncbi:MAG TPA: hypothetical protein VMU65_00865 [Candidatus Saccharimonadales bacterium]|nr:hypothetical protein [Candidatus Saccharimonadales bacterium]